MKIWNENLLLLCCDMLTLPAARYPPSWSLTPLPQQDRKRKEYEKAHGLT